MYQLFLDSDCDVTSDLCNLYGASLISMPYEINGESVYPYETWDKFDYVKFNEFLLSGKLGTTFAINVEKYLSYFEPFFKDGKDIVYIHFSKEMSSTFHQMSKALEILKKKYPDRKFYEVDTKSIALGSYNMILEALELYKKGASPEELVKFIEDEREHFASYYFVNDLEHFKRSGRVSGVAAFFGGLIGIKPIIYMSSDGKMSVIEKVKGKFNALKRLIEKMETLGDNIKKHTVVLSHALDIEPVNELKQMIIEKFGDDIKFEIHPLNPTAGCHCGPYACGVSFYAKHR